VNQILNRLNTTRIRKFDDEDPKNLSKYGLAKPSYTLSLLLGANRAKKTLLIGKKHESYYYAKDESRNPVFSIDSSFVKVLNLKLNDLRSKKIAEFKISDVDSFVLQFSDSTIICKKDTSNKWVLVEPVSEKTKSWKISSIVSTVANLRVEEFVNDHPKSLVPYGLNKPVARGKFFQDEKLLIDLLVGKLKDDKVYIKTGDRDAVYLAKKMVLKKLKPKLDDIIDKQESKKAENSNTDKKK